MKASYILKILNSLDTLEGFNVSIDFFGSDDGDISLVCDNTEVCEKSYSDGGGIYSTGAVIRIRLDANRAVNAQNRELLQDISAELCSKGGDNPFPLNTDGEIPLRVEIESGAVIKEDDIHTAEYDIKFRIYYLKK